MADGGEVRVTPGEVIADDDPRLGPIVAGPRFEASGFELDEGHTLFGLIQMGLLESPPLCTWGGWRNWRRTKGCRPPEPAQATGLKSAFGKREGRLYRTLMPLVHGEDWKDVLQEQLELEAIREEEA